MFSAVNAVLFLPFPKREARAVSLVLAIICRIFRIDLTYPRELELKTILRVGTSKSKKLHPHIVSVSSSSEYCHFTTGVLDL